ncbi:ATP-binding protein [Streptomyces sp. NPDC060065]|uniref:ATP-binding protein n=1 Tax=Streptomyces sp. NPDC060065 TaxID=3347050 RepID=UPI0036C80C09
MTAVISVAGNLPVALTSFVGRRYDIAAIRRLLGTGRLVTLTGAGGVGKTRLALEVAAASRKAFPDGVRLVELSPVRDPSVVADTVAAALRLPDSGSGSVLGRVAGHLAHRRVLLVLDNCEHLADACAELAQGLLSSAPELRILATSRQTLGLTGEHVFSVPSLSPDESAELLRDRTTAVRPEFQVSDANRAAVARLCTDLDGLPLAIELAAVRLRTLTVKQAADRLEDRFTLLTGGSRSTPARQRTLRALVDWSYELCTPAERLLWNRLSVFAGDFALDAAEEVCAGDGIAAHEVLDLLDRLVAQSVVLPTKREGLPRYRMLETIRGYGRARLAESGREQRLLRRHRDFFLALAEHLADGWFGPGQEEALARLRAEHGNLRAAMEYGSTASSTSGYGGETWAVALEPGTAGPEDPRRGDVTHVASDPADAQIALRLAIGLRFHWCADGFLGEGRRQFDRVLAAAPEPTPARAKALWAAAWVAVLQGDHTAADRWLDEAEELGQRLDAPVVCAQVQGFRGTAALFQGRLEDAVHRFEGALEGHKVASTGPAELFWLFQLANAQVQLGDPRAAETGRHAVATAEAHGERWCRSHALGALGQDACMRGDQEAGMALFRAALEIQRGFNDHTSTAIMLGVFVWISASGGDHQRAGRLLGAVRALVRDLEASLAPALREFLRNFHARCEEAIVGSLGPAAYEKALAEGGRHDSPARAIALALDTDTDTDTDTEQGVPAAAGPLTRRERQVAALVAQGMTNRQIAAELVLSPRTVDRHVENILTKLGFGRRAQIATWAAHELPNSRTA